MINEINLDEYVLVEPTSIKKVKKEITLYDIEVEDIHNFYIKTEYGDLLSHNCDGIHIVALLVNLFHQWFPKLFESGKIYSLNVPIMSYVENKKINYIYNLEEYKKLDSYRNIRYLKGLGSMSLEDWEYVFKKPNLTKFVPDSNSEKYLAMAFGYNAKLRKNWLEK